MSSLQQPPVVDGLPADDGRADALRACDAEVRSHHPDVRSLLVAHRGSLVWERYYEGVERDIVWGAAALGSPTFSTPYAVGRDGGAQNVKSVTKSVLSALVGVAVADGFVRDLDDVVHPHLDPDLQPLAGDHARGLTWRHLLQMRSGLEWVENGPITLRWIGAPDPVAFTLAQQEPVAAPGERWEYSTADSHLLGACLSRAVGSSLLDFANERLFRRLGFTADRWLSDPRGRQIGGSELFLTGRQMASFGQLFLQRGRWGEEQVLPASWVDLTTEPQPDVTQGVLLARAPLPVPDGFRHYRDGYGCLWWITSFRGIPAFSAQGFGGQLIVVIPSLEAVVVETMATGAGSEVVPSLERMVSPFALIEDFVVPALTA